MVTRVLPSEYYYLNRSLWLQPNFRYPRRAIFDRSREPIWSRQRIKRQKLERYDPFSNSFSGFFLWTARSTERAIELLYYTRISYSTYRSSFLRIRIEIRTRIVNRAGGLVREFGNNSTNLTSRPRRGYLVCLRDTELGKQTRGCGHFGEMAASKDLASLWIWYSTLLRPVVVERLVNNNRP